MKFILLIILSIFILYPNLVVSCICKDKFKITEAREIEYENSDLIVVGKVIEINYDEQFAIVQSKEIFKNEINAKSTFKIYSDFYCGPIIYFKGDWLIYASKIDSKLYVNVCGLSRSFENPDENRYFRLLPPPPPPPPSPDSAIKVFEGEPISRKEKKKHHKKARKLLQEEITLLRNKN